MTDWKKFIEPVDQLSLQVNLAEVSPDDEGARAFLETLSSFCISLKTALSAMEKGENPAELIKSLKTGSSEGRTYFDLHAADIPGFVGPARDLLDGAVKELSVLDKTPDDHAKIEEVFRAFHTLKGEANLTGLTSIALLSHEAEDLLGTWRSQSGKPDHEAVSVLLRAAKFLRHLLDELSKGPQETAHQDVGFLVRELQALRARKLRSLTPVLAKGFISRPPVISGAQNIEFMTDFVNEAFEHLTQVEKSVLVLEKSPQDSDAINNIFRFFHTIKGSARYLHLEDIEAYAHEAESLMDMVRKGALRFEGQTVELSLASIDGIKHLLTLLQEQAANNGLMKSEYPDISSKIAALRELVLGAGNLPIGEIMVRQEVITPLELENALKIQKETASDVRIGDILIATKAASAKQVEESLESQKAGGSVKASLRVKLEKLDTLMDMVGELVISESQVIQGQEKIALKNEHVQRNFVELDRITRNLQQLVLGLRLVPVAPTFQKMERFVRDLAKSVGKDVILLLSGEDTEIDKNMAELIADPLMHMVRNSVDHGIEFREDRIARGKFPTGKIELSAFHKGGWVVIEIRDDGAGLNREKILKKALEQGLVKEEEIMSDNRIFNFIFEPGFSTADRVTDVSGRGVGMDIVKKNVEKLQGKINVSSEPHKGTVFSIHFPITLAIVEGIVVRAAGQQYILPVNTVREFLQPKLAQLNRIYGQNQMYSVNGKVYPLIYLNDVFGIETGIENFEERTICVLESDEFQACLAVDELLGQQQVVIKSLGNKLTNIRGVSGAAILGDGRVGLIIDAAGLIEYALCQKI